MSPSRPGERHEQIWDEAHTRGSAFIVTGGARSNAEIGLPGGRPPPIPLALPAALAAIRVSPPGCLRVSMASTLAPWGEG